MNKNVLVTGASGNLGHLICEALIVEGFTVFRASSKHNTHSYYLDFENFDSSELLSVISEINVVIHCARVTNLESRVAIEAEMEFLHTLFLSDSKVIYIGSASSWLKTPSKYGEYKSTIEDFIVANGGTVATAGLIYGPRFQGQIHLLKKILMYFPISVNFAPVNSLYLTQIDYFLQELILLTRSSSEKGRYLISHTEPISFNSILKYFCSPGFRIPIKINSSLFLKLLNLAWVSSSYFNIDSFSSLLSEYDSKKMNKLGIRHISNGKFQEF